MQSMVYMHVRKQGSKLIYSYSSSNIYPCGEQAVFPLFHCCPGMFRRNGIFPQRSWILTLQSIFTGGGVLQRTPVNAMLTPLAKLVIQTVGCRFVPISKGCASHSCHHHNTLGGRKLKAQAILNLQFCGGDIISLPYIYRYLNIWQLLLPDHPWSIRQYRIRTLILCRRCFVPKPISESSFMATDAWSHIRPSLCIIHVATYMIVWNNLITRIWIWMYDIVWRAPNDVELVKMMGRHGS